MNTNSIEAIEYELKKHKTFDYMQPYQSLCDLCLYYYKNKGKLFWKKSYSAYCTAYLKQFDLTPNQEKALVYESLVGFSDLDPDKRNESIYSSPNYPLEVAFDFHTALCLCISTISYITNYDVNKYLSRLIILYRENSPELVFPYFILRSIFIYAINNDPDSCKDLFSKEHTLMANYRYDEFADIILFFEVVKALIENGSMDLATDITDYCVWKAQNVYSLQNEIVAQFMELREQISRKE